MMVMYQSRVQVNSSTLMFKFEVSLIASVRKVAKFNYFFDRQVIDGIPNGIGISSFFIGEAIKYVGGGRISSYIFFFVFIFLVICYSIFI